MSMRWKHDYIIKQIDVLKFLRKTTGYFFTPPMQELTGLVALADNVAVALGRRLNLLTYGDYTAGAGWSNSGGEVALHTAGNTATLQQDGILAAGRTYQAKVTVSGRTAGSITITEGGAAISANGQATRTITSTGANFIITPTTDFDGSLDLAVVLVQQTGILDSGAGLGLLDGTYSGVTLAQPGAGNIPYMVTFDGATSYLDIYSAELNSAFNPSAGTLIIPFRVANAGVWTDGSARQMVTLLADADNSIQLLKAAANGQVNARYEAGGVVEVVAITGQSSIGIQSFACTWDKSANEFKAYINGVQSGLTLAIAGTWVGNLAAATTVVGAASTTPTNVWHGYLSYSPVIATVALPPTTIAQISAAFGVA